MIIAEGPCTVTGETFRPYAGQVVFLESAARKEGEPIRTSYDVRARQDGMWLAAVMSGDYLDLSERRFYLLPGQRFSTG